MSFKTQDDKKLLLSTIRDDDQFLFDFDGKRRSGSALRQMMAATESTTKAKEAKKNVIYKEILSYLTDKKKLQDQLFKFYPKTLPEELLDFLVDEESAQSAPGLSTLKKMNAAAKKEMSGETKEREPTDVKSQLNEKIAKYNQLCSIERMTTPAHLLQQANFVVKKLRVVDQMSKNTLEWNEKDHSDLREEYKRLSAIVKKPNVEEYLKALRDGQTEALKGIKRIEEQVGRIEKIVTETLGYVKDTNKRLKEFQKEAMDKLNALIAETDSIWNNMALTATTSDGKAKYPLLGRDKPFSLGGDETQNTLDFRRWGEFQSPLVAWNAFIHIAFTNTFNAVSALVTNLTGGKSDFTVSKYLSELRDAMYIWISALLNLIFNTVSNVVMGTVSLISFDFKSAIIHLAKIGCSFMMALGAELVLAYVTHGALGSTLATFGSGLEYLVVGVQRYAFHYIVSIGVSTIDLIWYILTGFSPVSGGSYDTFLYTQIRLGIDSMASTMYGFMPMYPLSTVRVSFRGLINTVFRSLMEMFQSMYIFYIKYISSGTITATQKAMEKVATSINVDTVKVIETATCASNEYKKELLMKVLDGYKNSQSYWDWFQGNSVEVPKNILRYLNSLGFGKEELAQMLKNVVSSNVKPQWVMATITRDGGTLLMLKEHADLIEERLSNEEISKDLSTHFGNVSFRRRLPTFEEAGLGVIEPRGKSSFRRRISNSAQMCGDTLDLKPAATYALKF